MAVTRLQRKSKRNRIKASLRKVRIKQLLRKPVIKNLDIDSLKAAFRHNTESLTIDAAKPEHPKVDTNPSPTNMT